jgi:hypothetical protein
MGQLIAEQRDYLLSLFRFAILPTVFLAEHKKMHLPNSGPTVCGKGEEKGNSFEMGVCRSLSVL